MDTKGAELNISSIEDRHSNTKRAPFVPLPTIHGCLQSWEPGNHNKKADALSRAARQFAATEGG